MKIVVTVGPDVESQTAARVNSGNEGATQIDSAYFRGRVAVRIRDFDPADTSYFSNTSDTYSIEAAGFFLSDGADEPLTADDIVFGNDFDRPIRDRLPTGTSLAIRALQIIDPTMEVDAWGNKPSAFSPLLATVNIVRAGGDEASLVRTTEDSRSLWKGSTGDAGESSKARRAYFANQENRRAVRIEPTQQLLVDFSNPYIDFSEFAVRLPYVPFAIPVLPLWDGQPLRYTCKSRRTGVTFFCVSFTLKEEDK